MAKLLKINRWTGELGATDSLPHLGNFPLVRSNLALPQER
jgi:hypothetical protein